MGISEGPNSPHTTTDLTIERAVRSLVHDNRLKFDDCLALREELTLSEKQRQEAALTLTARIEQLENEYKQYRANTGAREDQIKADYKLKENEIMGELKAAEAYAEKVSSEAQVRERQLKKL